MDKWEENGQKLQELSPYARKMRYFIKIFLGISYMGHASTICRYLWWWYYPHRINTLNECGGQPSAGFILSQGIF